MNSRAFLLAVLVLKFDALSFWNVQKLRLGALRSSR